MRLNGFLSSQTWRQTKLSYQDLARVTLKKLNSDNVGARWSGGAHEPGPGQDTHVSQLPPFYCAQCVSIGLKASFALHDGRFVQ